MSDNHDTSRRDFLKKAGAVAWVVPTLQIINVAGAGATGTYGSPVLPPEVCVEFATFYAKANWENGRFVWENSPGNPVCVSPPAGYKKVNGGLYLALSGNTTQASVAAAKPDVAIIQAGSKVGGGSDACGPAPTTNNGVWTVYSTKHGISNVQVVFRACVRYGPAPGR